GSHSRTHAMLSALPARSAREEIDAPRRELEAMLGKPVLDFAYPYGGFVDFDETSRRLVEEAGYRCAVPTQPGLVLRGDDPFALRRCLLEDVPAFVAGFDLLLKVWRERRRTGEAATPLRKRASYLAREGERHA